MDSKVFFNSHSNTSLYSVLKILEKTSIKPFMQASPMPAAVNHSAEFFNHEFNTVFMQEWICVGRTENLKKLLVIG